MEAGSTHSGWLAFPFSSQCETVRQLQVEEALKYMGPVPIEQMYLEAVPRAEWKAWRAEAMRRRDTAKQDTGTLATARRLLGVTASQAEQDDREAM